MSPAAAALGHRPAPRATRFLPPAAWKMGAKGNTAFCGRPLSARAWLEARSIPSCFPPAGAAASLWRRTCGKAGHASCAPHCAWRHGCICLSLSCADLRARPARIVRRVVDCALRRAVSAGRRLHALRARCRGRGTPSPSLRATSPKPAHQICPDCGQNSPHSESSRRWRQRRTVTLQRKGEQRSAIK
jgi:hypothetical protein